MIRALKVILERWRTFLELRRIEGKGGHLADSYLEEQVQRAREDLAVGNRVQAITIWERVRGQTSGLVINSKNALMLLLDLGYFDEAERMMQRGRRLYPSRVHFAAGYAETARRRGDYQEALRRCKLLRSKFPRSPLGHTIAFKCLNDIGHAQEAEAMIERAVRKFPHDWDMLTDYAQHLQQRQDWAGALQRWEDIRDQFGHLSLAMMVCLRKLGRFSEAEKVGQDLLRNSPGNHWILIELAILAEEKGDLGEAVEHWASVRRAAPLFAQGYLAGANAMRRIHRDDDSDAILGEGVGRLTTDLGIHLEFARSAERRGDRELAAERWMLVRDRFPDHEKTLTEKTAA